MTTNTASEVLAYCGSCKMDLAAVIVAQVGPKIVKVQCKTCKKEHGFKAAKGVDSPAKAPKSRKPAAEKAPAVSIEAEWRKIMATAKRASIPYTPRVKLQLGDMVAHPSFGDGVVMKIVHPDKAELIFQHDIKLLIHSKQ